MPLNTLYAAVPFYREKIEPVLQKLILRPAAGLISLTDHDTFDLKRYTVCVYCPGYMEIDTSLAEDEEIMQFPHSNNCPIRVGRRILKDGA